MPGGNFGMWCVGGLGAIACVFAIVVGFFPPTDMKMGSIAFYEGFLGTGMLLMCAAPLIIYVFKKPTWVPHESVKEEG